MLGFVPGLLGALVAVAPMPGLDAIAAYAGTWQAKLRYFSTPYSKARVEASTTRNDCWRSADFYACHQFVNGASAALIVYTYDSKHNVYTSHIVQAGSPNDGSGTLLIAGKTWTYPWMQTIHGKTVYFRVVNVFIDSRTIAFRQDYSADKKTWTPIANGSEHRIGLPPTGTAGTAGA